MDAESQNRYRWCMYELHLSEKLSSESICSAIAKCLGVSRELVEVVRQVTDISPALVSVKTSNCDGEFPQSVEIFF